MRELKLMRMRGVCDELSKIVTGIEPAHLEQSLAKVGIRSQIFDSTTQHLVNDFVVVPDGACDSYSERHQPSIYCKFCICQIYT